MFRFNLKNSTKLNSKLKKIMEQILKTRTRNVTKKVDARDFEPSQGRRSRFVSREPSRWGSRLKLNRINAPCSRGVRLHHQPRRKVAIFAKFRLWQATHSQYERLSIFADATAVPFVSEYAYSPTCFWWIREISTLTGEWQARTCHVNLAHNWIWLTRECFALFHFFSQVRIRDEFSIRLCLISLWIFWVGGCSLCYFFMWKLSLRHQCKFYVEHKPSLFYIFCIFDLFYYNNKVKTCEKLNIKTVFFFKWQ